MVAVFFALKTRKVKIKALNDARWISMITYITSVILLILLISAQALEDFLNADAAVYSTCLILVSNVVLVILFTPKVSVTVRERERERGVHFYVALLAVV